MPFNFKKSSGFTLIELLVVISIIGTLAGLSLVSFSGSQKQARDTTRRSDLKQYQSLLTGFAAKNKGFYPQRSSSSLANTTLCSDVGSTGCPIDPKTATQNYNYCTAGAINTGAAGAASYALWGTLESAGTPTYFVICGNGKIGETSSVPTCGASFNCQLP